MKLRLSALLLCAVGMMPAAHAKTPGEVDIGRAVREATLQGLNGPSRKLSEFHGRPLIINVWASWCSPCREEMASLERLAWLELARHFNVIGISTDDDPAQAGAWLKESNATISQFVDTRLQMENMLGASRLPLTVLVDADGRVVDKIYGAREWDSRESLQLIRKAFRIPEARTAGGALHGSSAVSSGPASWEMAGGTDRPEADLSRLVSASLIAVTASLRR
jgi:thiol-disulfide isomerase/thioredoxin